MVTFQEDPPGLTIHMGCELGEKPLWKVSMLRGVVEAICPVLSLPDVEISLTEDAQEVGFSSPKLNCNLLFRPTLTYIGPECQKI